MMQLTKSQAQEMLAVTPFGSQKGDFVLGTSVKWRGLFAWGGDEGPCVIGAYLPSDSGLVEVHLGWENLSFPDAMPGDGYCFLIEVSEVRNWLTAAAAAKHELRRIAADGDEA